MEMDVGDSALGYILSGCIFYVFGLIWCYEYAKDWIIHPDYEDQENSQIPKYVKLTRACKNILRRHPCEGTLKLFATALGLASTLTGNLPTTETVSPKVVHATIYLFFALSGLIDVLNFYFPNVVGEGLAKMALAQGFFIEGYLFLWGIASNGAVIVLVSIVWTTSFSVILELVWPEIKLFRAFSTLLHAGWLVHMVRNYQIEPVSSSIQRIALNFSWHFAAAFVITLSIVAITRSCAPKLRHDQSPPVPVYDYCHQQDQRV